MFLSDSCSFQAVSLSECPCGDDEKGYFDDNYEDNNYGSDSSLCRSLISCNHGMNHNDLCEAEGPLPDGNGLFEIDNCPGKYDVFKCLKGK